MRNSVYGVIFMGLYTLAACGPCEVTTDVLVCEVDPTPGSAADDTAGSTSGGSEAGDSGESTGAFDGLCAINPGFEWGPCIAGGCPNAAVPSVCVVGDLGSACVPYCDSGCTMHLDLDCTAIADGLCPAPGATCRLPCSGPIDSYCPHSDMVCDDSFPGGPSCVWPTEKSCLTAPGETFAPCDFNNGCKSPTDICATDSNGKVCIPITQDGCDDSPCPAGPGGYGKGYGAQTEACTHACAANSDCAPGMVCGPNFGLCVWP